MVLLHRRRSYGKNEQEKEDDDDEDKATRTQEITTLIKAPIGESDLKFDSRTKMK